jgi:2,4-dienoyl-CoA reductase-like NADH-dependent reductase (Old Yellow Enzyme family)
MEVSLFDTAKEYQEIIKLLSDEPIDAISVSTYEFRQTAFGTDKNMARLAREVTELPLMICGGIYDRVSAEEALQDADIILAGKSALLNPHWVEDVRADKSLKRYKSEEADIAYTPEALP